jgi:hypothetical protein
MIQIKGIICLLLLSTVSVELPAFSMESPSIPGMFVRDSVPQKKVKRYIAWVDVAKPDGITGARKWMGRYRGTLRGITDSTLLFETTKPFADWNTVDAFYKIPYSDIQMIAFRRERSPLWWIGVGYGVMAGSVLVGALAGASLSDKNGGQGDLGRDLNIILGGMIGGMVGMITFPIVASKKQKFTLHGDKNTFDSHRMLLQMYVQ